MPFSRIIIRLVGAIAIFGTTAAEADNYRMLYSRGDFNPSFEKCLDENFSKRSGSEHFTETMSFFVPIYNNTYRTRLFNHISAFRHIEIIGESRSSLIVTVAVLHDTKGLQTDDSGHQLASKVPMEAISYIDGRNVYHAQVETRKLDEKDRSNFKTIVDCAGKSESR
jgi:hypothetical protein